MGVVLANQKAVRIHHIIEFKENIRLLLLSALFILLAARIELTNLLDNLNLNMLAFLTILIFLIRPAAVYLSTIFSPLSWKEKLFLCWMAPRGVVAASISSIFAISLVQNGFPEANQLISIVFITIISTVAIYGLTAPWVARKLGVAKPVPRGFLFVGAHDWAIDMATELKKHDVKVMIADSNWQNISNAKSHNIETYYGNVLSEFGLDNLNLDGIGKLISVTPNDEVNALTAIRFSELFGRSMVYQLSPSVKKKSDDNEAGIIQAGRILFQKNANFDFLTRQYEEGKIIKSTQLTETFTYQNFKKTHGDEAIPLFLVLNDNSIQPFTTDNPPIPQPGNILISMTNPDVDTKRKPEKTTQEKLQDE
jgi:hypothetical protein